MGSADGRLLWLELIKAVTAQLPKDQGELPTLKEKGLLHARKSTSNGSSRSISQISPYGSMSRCRISTRNRFRSAQN